jgi:hypothetical protein
LESLCCRDNFAISTVQQSAALIPACLFATMHTPLPLPQTRIPLQSGLA